MVTRTRTGDGTGVDGVVVHLDGARPARGLADLRAALVDGLRSGVPVLLVDIARVGRLSSTTVSALLWAQRRCRAQGGVVLLRGVDRRNARLLKNTGLGRIFDGTTEAAPEDGERSS